MRTKVPMRVAIFCVFAVGGCRTTNRPDAGPYCEGFVFIDEFAPTDSSPFWRREFGELRCNGKCPDGSPCVVQSQNFEPVLGRIIRREWCGCAGEREPTECHGVRELYNLQNQMIWRFNCHGNCPVKGEFCREVHRQVEAPAGVDKRLRAECECVAPT